MNDRDYLYSILSKFFRRFITRRDEGGSMSQKAVQQSTKEQSGLNSVLVALGPEDADRVTRLAEEATDIAGPAGATVVITHVFTRDEFESRVDALGFDREASEVAPDDVAVRYSPVRELAAKLEAAGVDYEVHGAIGHYGEKVVAVAEELESDLVLVGGRKRSPTGKAVFGSVAQEIMLSAPCPVTFVRADTQ
jgi:nucleotide-binding universal stress UspA family protein